MKYCLLLLLLAFSILAFSQNENVNVYDLNFEQLSKMKIVSVSKTEQAIGEVPTTIRVITSNDIRNNGYFTLEEALADLPGFQFRNILGINSYVFQRGIPNQNNLTLVLIDGVQLNELNSGGFYAGGQYNMSNIERIEVVYGPSSVAWGTNAITGIINIITKKPEKSKGEIHSLVGNFNTVEGDFAGNWMFNDNKAAIRVSGMVKKTDKANLKGAAGDNNWTDLMDNFENDYNLGVKLEAKAFTLGTNFIEKQTSTATMQKSFGTQYRDYGTSWNIRFVNSYLKYDKQLSNKLRLTSTLYNRNSTVLKNTVYYVLDTAQVGYYRPNNLTGLENILNCNLNQAFSLTSGLIAEFEHLANGPTQTYSDSPNVKPPVPTKPSMQNNYLISVFVEPRLRLFSTLFLSGGLRFDQSSIYKQMLTPRVGANYMFGRHGVRVSYSEAFRAPKPWDYTDGKGNPDLLPEKMKSIEAGMTIIVSKSLTLEMIGFENKLINGIIKEQLPEGYRWGNTGEIVTTGAELSAILNLERFDAYINYTFNHSSNEKGEHITEISPHSANAGVTYEISKRLKINLRSNYMGKCENAKVIASTGSKMVDPYLIFNGAVTYSTLKGLTLQLTGKNLFNAEYYHTSNRAPDRYRQPQRTVMLSARYVFEL